MVHDTEADSHRDHVVHHLLALWALGASPKEIRDMWEYNKPYQSVIETRTAPNPDLKDPKTFNECLAQNDSYADFLRFFEDEISVKGVPSVLREYLLGGDERGNDLLGRMFAGRSTCKKNFSRITC